MAADQRRKRLNGASVIDSSLREKFREKKKQMASPENGYKVKPHISLQWDGNRKKVVSKKAQIGLSSRNLRPFVESLPHGHHTLADAFDLPSEIFKLRSLEGVLSYEVWQSCLSEGERNFLMQFLPKEVEAPQVVKQLLVGDDIHCGNPFLKWAGSVLSGAQHPDAVIHHEKSIKADKREYYLQLQQYHSNMIDFLSKMKGRWESCKDPEKEFKHWIISESRKDMEEKFSTHADGSGFHVREESVDVATESSSLGPEEKTSNSDEQNSSVMKGGELQKRVIKKRTRKDRSGNSSSASDDVLNGDAKQRTGIRLKKRNILYNDGTKYMSYIKISKKQHEYAKSMEQSGTSIQSRSLGKFSNLQIQPYEVYVEEQQKKLHDHWLRLATNDLPAAYEIWKDFHRQRWHMMRFLEQDLKKKLDSLMQDEDEEFPETLQAQEGDEEIGQMSIMEEEEEEEASLDSSQSQQSNQSEKNASSTEEDDEELVPGFHRDDEDVEAVDYHEIGAKDHDESVPCSAQDMEVRVPMDTSSWVADDKFVPSSLHDHQSSPNQVPPLRVSHNFNHLNLKREVKADISAFSGDLTSNDLMGIHQAGGSDMWRPLRMEPTYYDSGGCHFGSTAVEMPLVHPPPNENRRQEQHWIPKNLLHHGQPSQDSFHNSYQSREQNELLHSIFNKAEQKSIGLNFQQPPSSMLPCHFQEPLQLPPLPLQQNMSGNLIPNGSEFLLQRQEQHLLPVSMQNWAPNPVHVIPSTLQSRLNGAELPTTQNWFGSVTSQQSIGSGSNLDQSLYSVLPQLPSRPSFDPLVCPEQLPFVPSRTFRMLGGGIGIPLPQTTAPTSLSYNLNRRDPVMSDESGWMSLPHQNPGTNDNSMGKPFMGSWNQ